jgi:hypothetical protein
MMRKMICYKMIQRTPTKGLKTQVAQEKREMMEERPHQNQRNVVDRVDSRSFMPKQFTQQESQ